MTQASPHLTPGVSRLVRALNELQVADDTVSHKQFGQRLAQLIDLADSINISSAHGKLRSMAFEPVTGSNEAIKQEFLRARTALIEPVIKSFDPASGHSRLKLPLPEEPTAAVDKAHAAAPYLSFYTAHQRQIDVKVQRLQILVRDAVAGLSPELAQLCALDTALGDTLVVHSRKFFAVIPQLLEQYFDRLLQQNQGQWQQLHQQLCSKMQELLLAEIEARLLPALGLIEATNEHSDNTKHE